MARMYCFPFIREVAYFPFLLDKLSCWITSSFLHLEFLDVGIHKEFVFGIMFR